MLCALKLGSRWVFPALLSSLLLTLVIAPAPVQADDGSAEAGDGDEVVIGGQETRVNADDDRDAKFGRHEELPDGVIVDWLRFSTDAPGHFFQIEARDVTQRDEGFRLRAGVGERYRFRAFYQSLPYAYGSGATFVLGRDSNDVWGPSYRIADFIQQRFEDPDGNATPFFTNLAETAIDNPLVFALVNDFLTGFDDTLALDSRRRQGGAGVTIRASERWTIDIDAYTETRDGTQALGTGTYQRITDVDGNGVTDYDYFFSARGIELPAILDYRTTRYDAKAHFGEERWFADVRAQFQEFENAFVGLTYDNPFWFNGVNATSGSRRGLWEFGRNSYEPSNEAWDLTASGGVDLPRRTRITAAVSLGEHTQDAPILPISTNPANIGTLDINYDGVVDASDDPTVAAIPGLPTTLAGLRTLGTRLDASSDVRNYYLQVTSRPVDDLTLTGRYRRYEYEGQGGILRVPARTEYVESRLLTNFKGDDILHVPLDWSRQTIDLDAAYRFNRNIKLKAFLGTKSYDYDQYADTDGNTTRDRGSRSVAGTDDDFYGLTAMFRHGSWLSGRATWQTRERDYDGTYTIAFSGELDTTRQYDIAKRDRDTADLNLDFMPGERTTFSLGYRLADDDYPESEYGFQAAESMGYGANLNVAATERFNLFAYVDLAEWDADMHMVTKCSNCTTPAGLAPWNVPNYDWFTDYTDETTSYGVGFDWSAGEKTEVDLAINFVQGQIEQKTANPGTPVEGNPANPLFGTPVQVARGFDFPTQESKLTAIDLEVTHRLSPRVRLGLRWRFEDFSLDDFQWDGLEPYGANFLTVDDATRYLFLNSRYSDYTGNVVGLFMRMHL